MTEESVVLYAALWTLPGYAPIIHLHSPDTSYDEIMACQPIALTRFVLKPGKIAPRPRQSKPKKDPS